MHTRTIMSVNPYVCIPRKRTISCTNWKIQIFVSNLFIVVFNKCARLRFKIFTIEQDKGSLSLKIKQIERNWFQSFFILVFFYQFFQAYVTPKSGFWFNSRAFWKFTSPKFESLYKFTAISYITQFSFWQFYTSVLDFQFRYSVFLQVYVSYLNYRFNVYRILKPV